MSRCLVCGMVLLLTGMTAAGAETTTASRANVSVKLWVDEKTENACEKTSPASGDWVIRNDEGRNVLVTLHRITLKDGVTTEDQTHDTLGPGEQREMGCRISDEGQVTLTLVKATY